jgi:hypothetical protein
MAIETPGLIVALAAVIAVFTGQHLVIANKIGIMVWRHTFAFMAGVALTYLHFGVFSVGFFFLGVGLLLQADKPKAK